MSIDERQKQSKDRQNELDRLEAQARTIRDDIRKKTGAVDILSHKGDVRDDISKLNNVEMHAGFTRIHQRLDDQDGDIQDSAKWIADVNHTWKLACWILPIIGILLWWLIGSSLEFHRDLTPDHLRHIIREEINAPAYIDKMKEARHERRRDQAEPLDLYTDGEVMLDRRGNIVKTGSVRLLASPADKP